MRTALVGAVAVAVLAGCGTGGAPDDSAVAAPPAASPFRSELAMPALDAHSKQLLGQALADGGSTVSVLVLVRPGAVEEVRRLVTDRQGEVLSADEQTGSLRARLPSPSVADLTSARSVTAVQVEEDIKREEPTP
jgi:hypothetical protein